MVGCTKPNPAVCCENEVECTRLGLAGDDTRPCTEGVCVANSCAAEGCDGDEDCGDPNAPFCVAGTCSAGCDGNEDCTDPDFPLCIAGVCSVDCEARGGRIVFHSDRDGDDDLFVMFADGFGPVPVLPSSDNERNARWSPDGTTLAFLSDDDADLDVYAMNLAAASPENLSVNTVEDVEIEWAPDGSKIAFWSSGSPLTATTMAPDETARTELVGVAAGCSVPELGAEFDGPRIPGDDSTTIRSLRWPLRWCWIGKAHHEHDPHQGTSTLVPRWSAARVPRGFRLQASPNGLNGKTHLQEVLTQLSWGSGGPVRARRPRKPRHLHRCYGG